MSIDPSTLATFAASTLDELERDEELSEHARLADAVLVVEVDDIDEDGDSVSKVHAYTMGKRNTAGVGMLYRGLKAMTE